MLEESLVRHCSPTLAGLKSGSLFNYSYQSLDSLLKQINYWNTLCGHKGLRLALLDADHRKSLIYVYRPENLKRDWSCPRISAFLNSTGYDPKNPEGSIAYLSYRIRKEKDFPHEIGLFLSYPFEDVIGFIKNRGQNCKYCGCWKVYCDE